MDTSIRLEELRGILRTLANLKAVTLFPVLSREVGLAVVHACKPQVIYLSGHVVFGDYLLDIRTAENTKRETRHDVCGHTIYPLPEGFYGDSRCFPLMVVTYRRWQKRGHGHYVYRQELLMTTSGEILVWDWFALLIRKRESRTMFEYAIRSKVRLVHGKGLKKVLSQPKIMLGVLDSLKHLFAKTVIERRKRLESMEGVESLLYELGDRLVRN